MIFAEFMDIFGFIGFIILFLTGLSIRRRERFASLIIIVISLLGIIVDGYVVLTKFILG